MAFAPTAMQRTAYAKAGWALPNGSYYIRPGKFAAGDLQNAIQAVGRGEAAGDSGAPIRKHIMKRAAECNMSDKIPDTWTSDGELKQVDEVGDFLAHYGVLGMHWGHHKGTKEDASDDHATAARIHSKAKSAGGIHALSNDELKTLNSRLELEQKYNRLNTDENVSAGHKAVKALGKGTGQVAGNIVKGAATGLGVRIATKQGEKVAKRAGLGGLL